MAVRTIETQHVHDGLAFGGIDDLANAQQRIAAGNGENFRDSGVGGGGVNFFVGVAEFDFVIALENSEKRLTADGLVQKSGKFGGVEVAGFESKRLTGGVAEAFELDDLGGGREGKAGRGFIFIVEHFGEKHFGAGGEAASGHLLGVAHQLIEVNFGSGDKRPDTAATLDDAFAFERSESVTSGHEADLMNPGKFAFGSDGITGTQLAGIDALEDRGLDALVSGHAVKRSGIQEVL